MEIIRRGFILKPRYLEIRMNAPIQGAAISCLLSYMCFRLKETAVAVRPSADASASMIQSPD